MSLYFDNEKLFDAEGHLTDAGLYALKDGTLDDLGALEAAEHLSFCDYCLLRYTALIEAAPEAMKQPMRDLIPQVQSLMRLRSFRIMTNRYVSAAAAVVLGFVLWGAVSTFGLPDVSALTAQQPTTPHERFGTKFSTAVNGFYKSLDDTFKSFTLTAENGLDQIRAQSIAGQMYYGYMQRGLSIAMILILCVMAATVVEPLLFLCLVIWMYSFFDTYDLIRHMAAGEPKEDSLLVLGNYEEIKKLIPQHNRLIGWGLVGFGVWALYETFISNWLYTLLCALVGSDYAYDIITGIPNVVIAALLIFAGLKLLGLHPETKHNDDELPPYPHE